MSPNRRISSEDLAAYLARKAAAQYIDRNGETLDILRKKGQIPCLLLPGGYALYHRDDLDAYLAKRQKALA